MDKRLIVNNMALGLIVLAVWLWTYHYEGRIKRKVDKGAMSRYAELRSNLKTELENDGLVNQCGEFYYNSQDTIYLTFVNFKALSSTIIDQYVASYHSTYSKVFSDSHRVKIYVKSIQMKITSLIGIVSNVKHEFAGIHTQKQNIYEVFLFNEFFDNQMIKDENKVFIKTSKAKLAEKSFIADVTQQSVYYLKRLKRFQALASESNNPVAQSYADISLCCLKQQAVYYIDSLEYVNNNKNLVFLSKYLTEINQESATLSQIIASKDLFELERVLLKNDYFIYTTIYMYEDY